MNETQEALVDFGAFTIRNGLWFLDPHYQSATVSFVHHTMFPIIIIIFYFFLKPNSPWKILFFLMALTGYLLYLWYDSCILTQIEYRLCKYKNPLLEFIDQFYPETPEQNKVASKLALSLITVFFGLNIIYDRKWFVKR